MCGGEKIREKEEETYGWKKKKLKKDWKNNINVRTYGNHC